MNEFIEFLYFLESIPIFKVLIETIILLVNFGYLLIKYVIPMMILIFMYINHSIAYGSAQWKSKRTWGTANQTFLNSVKFLSLPTNSQDVQAKNFIVNNDIFIAPEL